MFLHMSVILSTGGMHAFFGGACVLFSGGMCAFFQGGQVCFFRGHVCFFPGGYMLFPGGAYFFQGGMHAFFGGHVWFFLGGMRGFFREVCMVFSRGACMVFFWEVMCGFSGGACMVFSGGCAWFFSGDTVNERVVRILLECILVLTYFAEYDLLQTRIKSAIERGYKDFLKHDWLEEGLSFSLMKYYTDLSWAKIVNKPKVREREPMEDMDEILKVPGAGVVCVKILIKGECLISLDYIS